MESDCIHNKVWYECPDCQQQTGATQMDFKQYVRKPFLVEAVRITRDNIGEVADLVGELKQKDDGDPFIQVKRELVPNIYRVFLGFWMTRKGDRIRCYSPKVFKEQFTTPDTEVVAWVDFLNNGGVENSRTRQDASS
jgi:hypothetical protein